MPDKFKVEYTWGSAIPPEPALDRTLRVRVNLLGRYDGAILYKDEDLAKAEPIFLQPAKEPTMKPIATQAHHDGLGLADRMTIYADERDPNAGNASHRYEVHLDHPERGPEPSMAAAVIDFQHGPRSEPTSTPGILDGVLLAILLDRFDGFQSGPFACAENAEVVKRLEEALDLIKSRAMRRAKVGTLGTSKGT